MAESKADRSHPWWGFKSSSVDQQAPASIDFPGLEVFNRPMFVAFFESVKYTGHLLPIAFLRVFLGYYFLNQAIEKYQGDYLTWPQVAPTIAKWLPISQAPDWYKAFVEMYLFPYWKVFAYSVTTIEFVLGISFLIGFLVRPVALLGVILVVNFLFLTGPSEEDLYKTIIAILLTMAWLGAGRCLGFDYFFYKRRRGIWW